MKLNRQSLNIRLLVMCAMCIALGLVLPMAFHAIPNAGSIFLPMHIPVLLCGLICGPVYGLICGALTPLLSSMMTGMPPAAMLPGMLCELATYGLVGGVLSRIIRTKSQAVNIYAALVGAMICGRLVSGVLNALIFRAGEFSLAMWLSGAFVSALPGIVIQLVVIPLLIAALTRAHVLQPAEARREA